MKKTTANNKNKINKKRVWIYIRYVLPIFVVLLTVASLFIPCYLYTTVQGVDDDVYSLSGVIAEYWQPVCDYAFYSVGDLDPAILKFSRTVILSVIILSVLFTVGVFSTVYVAINAFRHFKASDSRTDSRMLFLTLIPNRIIACAWILMCVPLLLFPRYLIYLFKTVLGESATLTLTFPEPIIIFGILFVILCVFSAVMSSVETAQGMNPFLKKTPYYDDDDSDEDEQ